MSQGCRMAEGSKGCDRLCEGGGEGEKEDKGGPCASSWLPLPNLR